MVKVRPAHAAPLAGVGLLVAYLPTVTPYIPGGDAPELVTAALTGGVAHPPGYPLYSLLLRCVLLFPVEPALGANLLGAVLGALAGACVAGAVAAATGHLGIAVVVAWCAGLAPRTWMHAVGAEVFALNHVLCAGTLWVAWRGWREPSRAWARAVGLGAGLALSNHHTSILALAPMVVAFTWHAADRRRAMIDVGMGAFLGLMSYALLPLWARNAASMTWGDASTPGGLWAHVLRREYGTFQLVQDSTGTGMFASLAWQGVDAWRQSGGIGAVLGIVAIGWSLWRGVTWARAVAAGVIMHVLVFHALNNMPVDQPLLRGVQARFFLLPALMTWILVGVWVASVVRGAWLRRAEMALGVLAAWVAWGAVEDVKPTGAVDHYGHELLRVLPPRALVLARGDLVTGAMRYVQAARRDRQDVCVVDQETLSRSWGVRSQARACPDVVFPGTVFHPREAGAFNIAALVEANRTLRPVIVCGGLKAGDSSAAAYTAWPLGVCAELIPSDVTRDLETWLRDGEAFNPREHPVLVGEWSGESWEAVVQHDLLDVAPRRAFHLLASPHAAGMDPSKRYALVADLLQAHVTRYPQAPMTAWKNLGFACSRLLDQPGRAECMVRAWRVYLQRGPRGDKERAAMADAVARFGATTP